VQSYHEQSMNLVPHFTVTSLDGRVVTYTSIWQRRNLVLVMLPDEGPDDYIAQLAANMGELTAHDTACVLTRDTVAPLPRPGVAVADRWGELFHVAAGLPAPPELVEWLRYAQMQCPECRGEAR
jgi:hypothetical protein